MPLGTPTNDWDVIPRPAGAPRSGAGVTPRIGVNTGAIPAGRTMPASQGGLQREPSGWFGSAVDNVRSAWSPATGGWNESRALGELLANPTQYTRQEDPMVALLREQLAGITAQQGQIQNQYNTSAAQARGAYDQGRSQLERQYGIDAQRLAGEEYRNVDLQRWLNEQLFGISQSATEAQYGSMQGMWDLANRIYDDQIAAGNLQRGTTQQSHDTVLQLLNQLFGLGQQGYQGAINYSNQLRGFAGQERDLGQQVNQREHDASKRVAWNDAIARGAGTSYGHEQNISDLAMQLTQGNQGLTQQYNQTIAGLSERDRQALAEWQRQQAQITADKANNSTTWQERMNAIGGRDTGAYRDLERAANQYNEGIGHINRQAEEAAARQEYEDRMIDSLAADYGMQASSMRHALERGIANLGLDFNTTMQSLSQMASSSSAQQRAQYAALQAQILQYGRR